MWKKQNPVYCWWECTGTVTMENSIAVPPKTENLPYVPAFSLLGIQLQEMKGNLKDLKRYLHLQVNYSILTIGRFHILAKHPSLDEKRYEIYTKVLFSREKGGNPAICDNIDGT